jgi:hypothetical protein
MKEIMKIINEAMAEIPEGEDLNMTELNNLNDAAATGITEDVNGKGRYKSETGRYKSETQSQ